MRYYRYEPDANRFAGIGFSGPDGERVVSVHHIDTPLVEEWSPPTAHGWEDDPPTEGDFPSLNNFWRIPVMSQRAWDALKPLIGYCCEALPIRHYSGQPFYIIHVMETIDALDEERSEVLRNRSSGRVSAIMRYALKHELLTGKHIFKLPLKSGGELLVDDEFRGAVERHGLRGLLFKPVPMVGEQPAPPPPPEADIPVVVPLRDLSPADVQGIADAVGFFKDSKACKRRLRGVDFDDPKCLARIDACWEKLIADWRKELDEEEALHWALLGIGGIFGELLVTHQGYLWQAVAEGEDEGRCCVYHPERRVLVYALSKASYHYVNGTPTTFMLTYNMLQAGAIPSGPIPPGGMEIVL